MSKYVSLLLVWLITQASAAGQSFYIKGVLSGDEAGYCRKVYLSKISDLNNVFTGSLLFTVDSAVVDANGRFAFVNSDVIAANKYYRLSVVQEKDNCSNGSIRIGSTDENIAYMLLHPKSQINLTATYNKLNYSMVLHQPDAANAGIRMIRSIRKRQCELVDSLKVQRQLLSKDAAANKEQLNQVVQLLMDVGNISGSNSGLVQLADTVRNPYVAMLALNYLPMEDFPTIYKKVNSRMQ